MVPLCSKSHIGSISRFVLCQRNDMDRIFDENIFALCLNVFNKNKNMVTLQPMRCALKVAQHFCEFNTTFWPDYK